MIRELVNFFRIKRKKEKSVDRYADRYYVTGYPFRANTIVADMSYHNEQPSLYSQISGTEDNGTELGGGDFGGGGASGSWDSGGGCDIGGSSD